MEKKELSSILNDILVPIGFKKKGDYWIINGDIITKMVNLQKSKFGNNFYINYGYILKSIPLDNLNMHVFQGFGSIDNKESMRIKELLDKISNENRAIELKQLILDKIVMNIMAVKTEEDLLNELKSRPHLKDIPLVVKKYFSLPE